jgi:hypothetical protein
MKNPSTHEPHCFIWEEKKKRNKKLKSFSSFSNLERGLRKFWEKVIFMFSKPDLKYPRGCEDKIYSKWFENKIMYDKWNVHTQFTLAWIKHIIVKYFLTNSLFNSLPFGVKKCWYFFNLTSRFMSPDGDSCLFISHLTSEHVKSKSSCLTS